jgi:hypothetical protein
MPPLLVMCVRASQKAFFHKRSCSRSRAGGVSPPWGAFRMRTHRSTRVGSCTRNVTPRYTVAVAGAACDHHGGLTPAAPGNVRSCIAKGVFPPADVRTPTQERGASAPRGKQPNRRKTSVTVQTHPHIESRAGGVSPPWIHYRDCTGVCEHTAGSLPDSPEAFLQLRQPKPRRADARRSCWLTIAAD